MRKKSLSSLESIFKANLFSFAKVPFLNTVVVFHVINVRHDDDYDKIDVTDLWAGLFPEGGKTAWTDKTDLFFGAPKVFDASDEGASENFGVFSTGTAYDVIIFKFQGAATASGCPPPSERIW